MNDISISPDLYQFLGAYFHQDWDLEADDWTGVVDNYVNDDPVPGPLRALAQEIDVLRANRAEANLPQFMVRIVGVCYSPEPLTYKQWLGHIADRLREHANAIENGNYPAKKLTPEVNP